MSARIEIDPDQLAEFCRRWRVSELAVFGSVLHESFREDSDVDVLVTFEPDAHIGLIGLSRMERELSDLVHRKVDLVTKGGLKLAIRDEILREAEVLYAA